jgi:TolA-binding protein
MSAEMAMMVETMRLQMLQSQAQMAQTQQMLQMMMQQRQDDDRRYHDERARERSERARLEEATLAAAAAATNIAETMSSVSETVHHADAEDKVEVVKTTAALPKLEAATVAEPAVRCGDWLVRATMVIGSYSETASVWWSHVREKAQEAYDAWLASEPLERASVTVEQVEWHRYTQLAIRVQRFCLTPSRRSSRGSSSPHVNLMLLQSCSG